MKLPFQGPKRIRRAYIREVITEARRFKRRNLAELLEGRLEQLVSMATSR